MTTDSKPPSLGRRLLLSALLGSTVALLVVFVAWQQVGAQDCAQEATQRKLKEIRAAHVANPSKSFEELAMHPRWQHGRYGVWDDAWGRPLEIEVERVVSYGRDGKPGGRGLDCDLSTDDPTPAAAVVGFTVALNSFSGEAGLATGFLAFLLRIFCTFSCCLRHKRKLWPALGPL
jgi:hypothetical protein